MINFDSKVCTHGNYFSKLDLWKVNQGKAIHWFKYVKHIKFHAGQDCIDQYIINQAPQISQDERGLGGNWQIRENVNHTNNNH